MLARDAAETLPFSWPAVIEAKLTSDGSNFSFGRCPGGKLFADRKGDDELPTLALIRTLDIAMFPFPDTGLEAKVSSPGPALSTLAEIDEDIWFFGRPFVSS